ncbi:hypothetical protein [Streptomyces sp. NPDC059009]|uniref:hypothetical protein n=1 Tax=Streptomyces sp. NPDC059009 TaxID=3346694 RepID=UPI0036775529
MTWADHGNPVLMAMELWADGWRERVLFAQACSRELIRTARELVADSRRLRAQVVTRNADGAHCMEAGRGRVSRGRTAPRLEAPVDRAQE